MKGYLTTKKKVREVYSGLIELYHQAWDDFDSDPSAQLENILNKFEDAVEWFHDHYSGDLPTMFLTRGTKRDLLEDCENAMRYEESRARRYPLERSRLCTF